MAKDRLVPEAFEMGQKLKIMYQIPGVHRKPRETVAAFIGLDDEPGGQILVVSGRPEFGTASIRVEFLLSVRKVSKDTKCHVGQVVR